MRLSIPIPIRVHTESELEGEEGVAVAQCGERRLAGHVELVRFTLIDHCDRCVLSVRLQIRFHARFPDDCLSDRDRSQVKTAPDARQVLTGYVLLLVQRVAMRSLGTRAILARRPATRCRSDHYRICD